MKDKSDNKFTDEPSELQLDYAFIDYFGEPMRDTEQLSWDNLEYDSKWKVIRCKTCGCPKEICTCQTFERFGLTCLVRCTKGLSNGMTYL